MIKFACTSNLIYSSITSFVWTIYYVLYHQFCFQTCFSNLLSEFKFIKIIFINRRFEFRLIRKCSLTENKEILNLISN